MSGNVVEMKQSVRERVQIAIDFLQREHPDRPLTVAMVARSARVNRANLYACHSDLIETILGRSVTARAPKDGVNDKESNDEDLKTTNKGLVRQNRALL